MEDVLKSRSGALNRTTSDTALPLPQLPKPDARSKRASAASSVSLSSRPSSGSSRLSRPSSGASRTARSRQSLPGVEPGPRRPPAWSAHKPEDVENVASAEHRPRSTDPARRSRSLTTPDTAVKAMAEEQQANNELAYLRAQLLSETRCREELEVELDRVKAEYTLRSRANDTSVADEKAKLLTERIKERDAAQARVDDVNREMELMKAQMDTLHQNVNELQADLQQANQSREATQQALEKATRHVSKANKLNKALQREVTALKKQASDNKASAAVSAVVDASRNAASSREQNQVKFLKQQLRHEVMHRAEVEADFEKTVAKLTAELQAANRDAVANEAAVESVRRESERQMKAMRGEAEELQSQAAVAKTEQLLAEQKAMELRGALRRRDAALGDKVQELRRLESMLAATEKRAATAEEAVSSATARSDEALAAGRQLVDQVTAECNAKVAAAQEQLDAQGQQLLETQASLLAAHNDASRQGVVHAHELGATRIVAVVKRWRGARQRAALARWSAAAAVAREADRGRAIAEERVDAAVAAAILAAKPPTPRPPTPEATLEDVAVAKAEGVRLLEAAVSRERQAAAEVAAALEAKWGAKLKAAVDAAKAETRASAAAEAAMVSRAAVEKAKEECTAQAIASEAAAVEVVRAELEAAQQTAAAQAAAALAVTQADATTTVAALQQQVAGATAQHADAVNRLQYNALLTFLTACSEADRLHVATLTAVQEENCKEHDAAATTHEAAMDAMECMHREEVRALVTSHAAAVREADEKHAAGVAAVESQLAEKMAAVVQSLHTEHQQRMDDAAAAHQDAARAAVALAVEQERGAADERVRVLDSDWTTRWEATHEERAAVLDAERRQGAQHVAMLEADVESGVAERAAVRAGTAAEAARVEVAHSAAVAAAVERVRDVERRRAAAAVKQAEDAWESATASKGAQWAKELAAKVEAVQEEGRLAAKKADELHQAAMEDAVAHAHREAAASMDDLRKQFDLERGVAASRLDVVKTEAAAAVSAAAKSDTTLASVSAELEALKLKTRAEASAQQRRHQEEQAAAVDAAVADHQKLWEKQQQAVLDSMETSHREALIASTKSARAAAQHALLCKDQEIAAAVADGKAALQVAAVKSAQLFEQLRDEHAKDSAAASAKARALTRDLETVQADLEATESARSALDMEFAASVERERCLEEGARMAAEDMLARCTDVAEATASAHAVNLAGTARVWEAQGDARVAMAWEEMHQERCAIEARTLGRIKAAEDAVQQQAEEDLQAALQGAAADQDAAVQEERARGDAALQATTEDFEAQLAVQEAARQEAVAEFMKEAQAERQHMMEQGKLQVAAALAKAAQERSQDLEARLAAAEADKQQCLVDTRRDMRQQAADLADAARQEARTEAEAEQQVAMQEVQVETERLVSSFEEAMADMAKERDQYGQQNDQFKADLVMEKAKVIKLDKLTTQLRRAGALSRAQVVMLHCSYVSRYRAAEAVWTGRVGGLETRLATADAELVRLRSLRDAFASVLDGFRNGLTTDHKADTMAVQDEVDTLLATRTERTAVKDDLKAKIGSTEGQIKAIEKEIRKFASTTVIKNGKVDMTVARNKRGLDAELDTLLDRLQDQRKEFFEVDSELSKLEAVIEAKEDRVRDLESSFVEHLLAQIASMVSALKDCDTTCS